MTFFSKRKPIFLAPALGLVLLLVGWQGNAQARNQGATPEPATPVPSDAAPGVWDAEPEAPADMVEAVPTGATPAPKTDDQDTAPPPDMTPRELDIWRMARLLDVPYPLLKAGVDGLEELYARRYLKARAVFEELEEAYPESAVGPFGLAVLAQARMAENLDFSQDEAYQKAFKVVIERIDAAIDDHQSLAWNYFMRGTVLGMNSFYNYRQDKVLAAIKDGWIGINDLERARKLEPDFVDPILGVGLYNYWRSVVTIWFKNLPFFPDRRKEGLEQMIYARDHGVFAPPLARLSLAFSFYESRRIDDALKESLALYEAYPDNIINLQVLGRLYMRKHKHRKAEKTLLRVLEIDPSNVQVHYALGYLYFYRLRDLNKARNSLAIVADKKPGTYYGEMSRVRLGDVYWLLGEHQTALALWRQAYDAMPSLKAAELRVKKDWRPPDRPWRKQIAAAKARTTNTAAHGEGRSRAGGTRSAATPAARMSESASGAGTPGAR